MGDGGRHEPTEWLVLGQQFKEQRNCKNLIGDLRPFVSKTAVEKEQSIFFKNGSNHLAE